MTMNRADKAAGHWAEGVPGWTANATSAFPKILLTETRTAAKKHQIPSAGSTSQTPKQRLFRPQENPRKQRWGCPGLFVVVLTSLVWAARSGPLLQSYWADRPASSLVRLFLTLYTTPSLSLESSTQRQINPNAFASPPLGFHILPSPEDCFKAVSKSLSMRCVSPQTFLGKGDLSWPTDTARRILPSLSSLDKIQSRLKDIFLVAPFLLYTLLIVVECCMVAKSHKV